MAEVPTVGWLTDLATHWQWLYVPLAMISGIVAWHGLARLGALLVLGAGLFGLWAVMPPLTPEGDRPGTQTIRVITANVHLDTTDPAGLLGWARAQQADVILLQEINPVFAQALDTRATGFPHRHLAPRDDPFGIGVISRHPLSHAAIIEGAGGIPILQATIEMPGGGIPILVTHPFPPLSAAAHCDRADTITQLDALAATTPALIVAGDFNASPWSSVFARVKHLSLASRGLPTWRAVLPIDHVLAGPDWTRLSADRGPAAQSDHRPLMVTLSRTKPR